MRAFPQHSLHPLGKSRWAMELQPEFPPMSQERLAADDKGIYAGLVMAEAKCINNRLSENLAS
jgi:hypothetical protein